MEINLKELRETVINYLYQIDLLQSNEIDIEEEDVKNIIDIILENINDIDDIISASLFNYQIERLSYMDRAIIRFATYELKYTENPSAIVINEAVNISKKYTDLDDEKQHKFNNKVLDTINKTLRGWFFAKSSFNG